MRHDVGEVVRSSEPADRHRRSVSASSVATAMWSRASSRRPVDASIHAASSRALGPVADRGRVAGRVERSQDSLCAAAVAEDDPGPAEPVGDARARAAGRARRSRPVRRRCWRARSGRRRDARPGGGCGHRRWRTRLRRRTTRRARRRRDRTARPRSSLRARTHGCCRAAGTELVRRGVRRRRRSRANGSRAGRPRRSPRRPARRAPRGRTRPPVGARRRRRWRVPTGRAGRRGTTGRSSTGSSTAVTGGVPVCGWSGRSTR